jgi:membrane protein insertase Oxa1/YidC/SpoIIIJ
LVDPYYILPVVTASTIYLQLYFSADGMNTDTMPPVMKKVSYRFFVPCLFA